MRKVVGCLAGLLFWIATPLMAEIYIIPEPLLKEVEKKYAIFEAHPTSNEALFNLAMAYAYTGQIRKGWATLKKVDPNYADTVINTYLPLTKSEPKEWRHYFKLAFGHYFKDEKEKCVTLFETALVYDPENVWVMAFIALVKGDMGYVDETIEICKKALKIEPNATAIHFLLGVGYQRKGELLKCMKEMMIVGRLETEEAIKRPYAKKKN